MQNQLKKHQGEVDGDLLKWLEKYGYDESDLLEDEEGNLYVMYEEDEGSRHPDDPCRPATYPMLVDLDEVIE